MKVLLVLYTHTENNSQMWTCYFGGHKEANTEGVHYLKEGYREIKRLWMSESCFDMGDE